MNIKSCKIASRLISDSFERKLSIKETISLKIHLMMCKGCTLASKQMNGIRNVLTDYTSGISSNPAPSNKSLSEKAKLRIKEKLNQRN